MIASTLERGRDNCPLSVPTRATKTGATAEAGGKKGLSYEPLSTRFRRDGFAYRQIAREGNAAIYEQTWIGSPEPSVCYEVIRIRRHDGFQLAGDLLSQRSFIQSRKPGAWTASPSLTKMRPLRRCGRFSGAPTMLELPDSAERLPELANNCFIVGEAKRADVIWSEGDFLALCEHMLNENPPNHFLTAWIDQEADKRDSQRLLSDAGPTSARAGHGLPSPERPKARRLSAFIHRIAEKKVPLGCN